MTEQMEREQTCTAFHQLPLKYHGSWSLSASQTGLQASEFGNYRLALGILLTIGVLFTMP